MKTKIPDHTSVFFHFTSCLNCHLFLFFLICLLFILQEYFSKLHGFSHFSHHGLEAVAGKVPCVPQESEILKEAVRFNSLFLSYEESSCGMGSAVKRSMETGA